MSQGIRRRRNRRLDKRDCELINFTDAALDGICVFHSRQALRITRYREEIKGGRKSVESTLGVTSLATDWTGSKYMAYPRTFNYDEDRCRDRIRHLMRNLAITLMRLDERFDILPSVLRGTVRRGFRLHPEVNMPTADLAVIPMNQRAVCATRHMWCPPSDPGGGRRNVLNPPRSMSSTRMRASRRMAEPTLARFCIFGRQFGLAPSIEANAGLLSSLNEEKQFAR